MVSRAPDRFSQAERDLGQAEDSRRAGRHEWACFAAHQAAEKAVKALHLHLGQEASERSTTSTRYGTVLSSSASRRRARVSGGRGRQRPRRCRYRWPDAGRPTPMSRTDRRRRAGERACAGRSPSRGPASRRRGSCPLLPGHSRDQCTRSGLVARRAFRPTRPEGGACHWEPGGRCVPRNGLSGGGKLPALGGPGEPPPGRHHRASTRATPM